MAVAVIAIVAAVIVLVVSGDQHPKSDGGHRPGGGSQSHPSANRWNAALAKLDTLPVKGRAPKTGYTRDAFGLPWTDDVDAPGGQNGCATRDDILRRDLTDLTSHGCTVISGTLHDLYTGTTIPFHRGSSAVQIDHVVALDNAWQTGAQQLDLQTRQKFANDPANLQATDGPTNQRKGAGDAATWLPPNKAYRCTYVARQVDIKARYGLWVTQPEHDKSAELLHGCATGTEINTSPCVRAVRPSHEHRAPSRPILHSARRNSELVKRCVDCVHAGEGR